MDVRMQTLEPIDVAGIRHVGRYADVVSCFERLCGWAPRLANRLAAF